MFVIMLGDCGVSLARDTLTGLKKQAAVIYKFTEFINRRFLTHRNCEITMGVV